MVSKFTFGVGPSLQRCVLGLEVVVLRDVQNPVRGPSGTVAERCAAVLLAERPLGGLEGRYKVGHYGVLEPELHSGDCGRRVKQAQDPVRGRGGGRVHGVVHHHMLGVIAESGVVPTPVGPVDSGRVLLRIAE